MRRATTARARIRGEATIAARVHVYSIPHIAFTFARLLPEVSASSQAFLHSISLAAIMPLPLVDPSQILLAAVLIRSGLEFANLVTK